MTYYRHYTPFYIFSGIGLFVFLVVGFTSYSIIIWPIFSVFVLIALTLTLIQDEVWLDPSQKQIVFLQGLRYVSKPKRYNFDQLSQLRTERVVVTSKYSDRIKYQLFVDIDPTSNNGKLLMEADIYKSLVDEANGLSDLTGCPLVEGPSLKQIRDELGPPI